jgi:16S rRNA G966 N2-methylase RsmD
VGSRRRSGPEAHAGRALVFCDPPYNRDLAPRPYAAPTRSKGSFALSRHSR